MSKVRYYKLEIQPFHTPVNIIIAKNISIGMKWVNKNLLPKLKFKNIENEKDTLGLYAWRYKENKEYNLIFLREDSSDSTIIHECFHAIMRISYDRGAEYSKESDEFFAYSFGNFTGEVLDLFYGRKK